MKMSKDSVREKLDLKEFRKTGITYDISHVESRWRECLMDARLLGNVAYPRLKTGEKWGDWNIENVLKYFGKLIDALRSVKFIIPEKKRDISYWECYWKSKKKGYLKSSPPTSEVEIKKWNIERGKLIETKSLNKNFIYKWLISKNLTPQYLSLSKPAYRAEIDLIESDLKNLGWIDKELLIDSKIDGLRLTIGKINGKGFAFVDPSELKEKSPDVSNRLPGIIEEIENNWENNTICDSELFAMKDNDVLHRTSTNSIINSDVLPEKIIPYINAYVFRTLFYKGKDLRLQSLRENLEYLPPRTNHVFPMDYSYKVEPGHSAYIVNGDNFDDIRKVWDLLINDKGIKQDNKFITHFVEGVMIKLLSYNYYGKVKSSQESQIKKDNLKSKLEEIQNKAWTKIKRWKELDCIILKKDLVKGSSNTWNYLLGLEILEEYAKKLASMDTKNWYYSVGVLINGRLLRGKEILDEDKGRWVMILAHSDNTNIDGEMGDILRISAEEVIRYNNKEQPSYPRYSFYIGRAMELIPEKNVSDDLEVVKRLSLLEPKRIPIAELVHLREKLPVKLKSIINKIHNFTDEELLEIKKQLV